MITLSDDNTPILTTDQRIAFRKDIYHSLCREAALLRKFQGEKPAKLLMETQMTIERMGVNLLMNGHVTEDELAILSFVTEDELTALRVARTHEPRRI